MILVAETFSIHIFSSFLFVVSSFWSIVQHCCCWLYCSFFYMRNRKDWKLLSIGSHPITFWLLKFQTNNSYFCLWLQVYSFTKRSFFPSFLWAILYLKPTKFNGENFRIYKVFLFDSYFDGKFESIDKR